MIDREGNEILVFDEYTRIVSYAPSLTEILVDMGYGDKIIAMTLVDQWDGAEEGTMLFDMMNPDIEGIVALEPDLILTTNLTAAGGSNPFDVLGDSTTIAVIPTANSLMGIYEDITFIGELLGEQEKAVEIVGDMQMSLVEFMQATAGLEEAKTVYFEISPSPYMYSTGKGTYLNEMIEMVGAQNALSVSDWVAITDEMVVEANPDVIITNVDYVDDPIGEIMSRNGWDSITAIQNGDVYQVDKLRTSLSNHNVILGMQEIARVVYPDLYE
ncbi:MAG: hypothetical protein ATN35_13310 [Epulopiscium sp. Nele67-Bin004]|nr:MAG: hypothetical protein ATN35_13310 [Epulopiscium sp. Nele67-Bin004]